MALESGLPRHGRVRPSDEGALTASLFTASVGLRGDVPPPGQVVVGDPSVLELACGDPTQTSPRPHSWRGFRIQRSACP